MTAKDFLYGLPGKVQPGALDGPDVTFHFDFTRDDAGQFTVRMADGQLRVSDGLLHKADCTVKGKGEDFVRVCSGDLNPMMAIMTGKLKVSDPGKIMRYAKVFGLT